MRALLQVIRRETDTVFFSGGEPLMRPDLEAILGCASELGFARTCLLTNGYALDERPDLLGLTSSIIVSLDTLDTARGDRLYGRGAGVTRRILENIELARSRCGDRSTLWANICILPETLPDLPALLDFLARERIGFLALPVLRGVYADPALVGNPAYQDVVDRIMSLKRQGHAVLASMGYYRHIRDFSAFPCRPTLSIKTRPDGALLYPCHKLNLEGGNLVELGDYRAALEEGVRRHGAVPQCDSRCHECCQDFTLAVESPSLLLEEGYYQLKASLKARTRADTTETQADEAAKP